MKKDFRCNRKRNQHLQWRIKDAAYKPTLGRPGLVCFF